MCCTAESGLPTQGDSCEYSGINAPPTPAAPPPPSPPPLCAPGCEEGWPGDGYCNEECNNAECNFDGGDFEGGRCEGCAPGCAWEDPGNPWNPYHGMPIGFGDGICDDECNNPDCGYDGGDCGPAEQCAPGCEGGLPGDGVCDDECNNAECNFDGGDCTHLFLTGEYATFEQCALLCAERYNATLPCITSWEMNRQFRDMTGSEWAWTGNYQTPGTDSARDGWDYNWQRADCQPDWLHYEEGSPNFSPDNWDCVEENCGAPPQPRPRPCLRGRA